LSAPPATNKPAAPTTGMAFDRMTPVGAVHDAAQRTDRADQAEMSALGGMSGPCWSCVMRNNNMSLCL